MEAQNRIIEHPTGQKLKTPLLVPSFSSKGFAMNKGKSEVWNHLIFCKEFLYESLLISAYDLHYKHIPKPNEFGCTEITFIDSGGYETSYSYDLSSNRQFPQNTKNINDWNREKLIDTYKKWPKRFPGVIVNFDHGLERKVLRKQIKEAESLFTMFPTFLHDFIIKPERRNQNYLDLKQIKLSIHDLKNFHIIGVTEKELGDSILNRMILIRRIKLLLKENGIDKPIHIFGSLDPVTSILYFLAGAEIFDGLTWLRFSYFNGMAIYPANYSVLNHNLGIQCHEKEIRTRSFVSNLDLLRSIKYMMIDYLKTKSFDEFSIKGYPEFSSIIRENFIRFENNKESKNGHSI